MDTTILAVIIGGVIGIVPSLIQGMVTILLDNKEKKQNRQAIYRREKIEAYKKLLNFINVDSLNKEVQEFDFYYVDVLPYASQEICSLVDVYYDMFFEPNHFKKNHYVKDENDFKMQKGLIVGQINHQIKEEIQLFKTDCKKKRLRKSRY